MKTILALALLLGSCIGCGGKKEDEQGKPKVVLGPDGKEPKKDPAGTPKAAAWKLVDINLTPHGVVGTMQVPEGSVPLGHWSDHNLRIEKDGEFALHLSEVDKPLDSLKREFTTAGYPLAADETFGFIVKMQTSLKLFADAAVGGTTYRFYALSEKKLDAEQMKQLLMCAKSLSQSQDLLDAVAKSKSAIDELKKLNCSVAERGAGRWSIAINGDNVTDDSLASFKSIINATDVSVGPAKNLTEKGFAHIAANPSLSTLTLPSQATDAYLESLKGAKSLQSIKLTGTRITNKGLQHLGAVKSLTQINLSGLPIGEEGVESLIGLPNLTGLDLSFTQVGDKALKWLAECPQLQRLSLLGTAITDSGLQSLAALRGLTDLDLSRTRINGTGLVYLKELTKLRNLGLSHTEFNDKGFERIKLPGLESLIVPSTLITDAGLKNLSGAPALAELVLDDTAVTDAGIGSLKSLKNLRVLTLDGTAVRGSTLGELKEMASLKEVSLNRSAVTDADLAKFADLPLERIGLDETAVTNAGIDALIACKAKTLNLHNTRITDGGKAKLRAAGKTVHAYLANPDEPDVKPVPPPKPVAELPKPDVKTLLKKLKRTAETDPNAPADIIGLDLGGSGMSDLDIAELRELKKLRNLNLSDNDKITDVGLAYLADLPELISLDLAETKVTGDGLVHLKSLKKLHSLMLPFRRFTSKQLAPLAELKQLSNIARPEPTPEWVWFPLQANWPNLERLQLNSPALFPFVKPLAGLQEISLGGTANNRTLENLKDLKNLKALYIATATPTESGLAVLSELPELAILDLSGISVSDNGTSEIKKAAKLGKLSIYDAQRITDRGAADIRDVSSLGELQLRRAGITNRALEMFTELKDLEVLLLPGASRVTDGCWPFVKKMEEIRVLDLSGSGVTGKGIEAIAELPKLRDLRLADTPFTDDSVARLKAFAELQFLDLSGTEITDTALADLKTFPKLIRVTVSRTKVSDKAIAALKVAKPELNVLKRN